MTHYKTESEAESFEAAALAKIALQAAIDAVDAYQACNGTVDAPFQVGLYVDNGNGEDVFEPDDDHAVFARSEDASGNKSQWSGLDIETTRLSPAEARRFADALDNPPEPNEALKRAAKAHDEYTGWIRHDGGECPVHPMDVVEVHSWYTIRAGMEPGQDSAGECSWDRVRYYRPLRDDDGVPYCTAEGLWDWAKYVVTDASGVVWQYAYNPIKGYDEWYDDPCLKASPEFANTRDHWTQTLRRVWRGEKKPKRNHALQLKPHDGSDFMPVPRGQWVRVAYYGDTSPVMYQGYADTFDWGKVAWYREAG